MTRRAINLLNMLKSVAEFYTENPTILVDKPTLKAAVGKLNTFIGEVEALEKTQARKTKTDTALKAVTKSALINATLKVLAGMAAHAAATNDIGLKMEANITKRDLNRMRGNNLVTKVLSIYESAVGLVSELTEWEVTQDDISALKDISAAFDAKDPAIKIVKARSMQATADIKIKLDEARIFTKTTLDAMMLPLKMSNPTLYGQYKEARTIINTAGARKKGTPVPPDIYKPD